MSISTRVIPHQKEKRGVLHRFTLPIVVCELCYWKISGPVGLLVVHKKVQVCLHPLVILF